MGTNGAEGRDRTCDNPGLSGGLYQLGYNGIWWRRRDSNPKSWKFEDQRYTGFPSHRLNYGGPRGARTLTILRSAGSQPTLVSMFTAWGRGVAQGSRTPKPLALDQRGIPVPINATLNSGGRRGDRTPTLLRAAGSEPTLSTNSMQTAMVPPERLELSRPYGPTCLKRRWFPVTAGRQVVCDVVGAVGLEPTNSRT